VTHLASPPEDIAPVSAGVGVNWITVDGLVLPDQPLVLYDDPNNIVPEDMIIGTTSYDSPYAGFLPAEAYITQASNMETEVRNLFGDMADRVLQAYSPTKYGDNQVAAYSQFQGDLFFLCPSRQFVSLIAGNLAGNVYLYNYAYLSMLDPAVINGLYDLAEIDDPTWATHAADVLVTFGNFDAGGVWFNISTAPASEDDLAVSGDVMARWASFARSGNPNNGSYLGWDPVPAQGESSSIQTFVWQKGGGQMLSVEDKVNQCSSFYSPQKEPTNAPISDGTSTNGSSADESSAASALVKVMTVLAMCQAFPILAVL